MSTPTTHSPGPWKTEIWKYSGEKPHRDLIVQNDQFWLAKIAWDEGLDNPYTIREQEARANAALIAAAPELLAALKSILGTAEVVDAGNKNQFGANCHGFAAEVFEQCRAAIAKATTITA